jgi:VWFA-related protein
MKYALVLALIFGVVSSGLAGAAFGQGRPRRVTPLPTAPPPGAGHPAVDPQRQTRPHEPSPPDAGEEETLVLEGALVEVPVVVTDRMGRYVPQLEQQDFRVLEDGEPQQIVAFSTERVPVHVALVMDTSGSTRGTIHDIQEAAIEFIDLLEPGDQVLVISFASEVVVEQEFTNNRGRLAAAVRRTHAAGSTKLYEAVYLTVAERLRQVDGRKAMVILSDGEDTASREVTFDEAVAVCFESDVVAYGIRYPDTSAVDIYRWPSRRDPWPNSGPRRDPWPGTSPRRSPPTYPQPRPGTRRSIPGWPRMPRVPGLPWPFASPLVEPQFGGRSPGQIRIGGGAGRDPFMETITESTGGTLVYADAVSDVRGVLGRVAEELRQRYMVGYAPSNPLRNGGHRKITVRVPSRPDLRVRHRLGYQAEAVR